MSRSLSSFLAGEARPTENRRHVVSDRFVNAETGKPEEWEYRIITAQENSAIRKGCIRTIPAPGGKKGHFTQDFDATLYQAKLAVACTVFPDLNDAALQDSYKVMGAENLVMAMLLPGEFEDYSTELLEAHGFTNQGDLVDEAKN